MDKISSRGKLFFIMLIILVILLWIGVTVVLFINVDNTKIPDGYVAVFKGETSDVVYSTYVYRVKKKKSYKYVNTISTIVDFDNYVWDEKVVKKGKAKNKKELFKIAKKNFAYTYVKYQDDNNIYSVDEFDKIFE